MKQHIAKMLVKVGDFAAKNAVCAASPSRCFQPEEPKTECPNKWENQV